MVRHVRVEYPGAIYYVTFRRVVDSLDQEFVFSGCRLGVSPQLKRLACVGGIFLL